MILAIVEKVEALRKILAIWSSSIPLFLKMTLKILVGDSSFALSEECLLGQDRFHVISGIW